MATKGVPIEAIISNSSMVFVLVAPFGDRVISNSYENYGDKDILVLN